MLLILAPSKTMDFIYQPSVDVASTEPLFLAKSQRIAAAAVTLPVDDVRRVFHVSQTLAQATQDKYARWGNGDNKKAMAIWAYVGDVYKGFYAKELTESQLRWADQHMLIISGLYGLLRPFDMVEAYRLEMKAKLSVDGRHDLYDFWGQTLADYADSRSDGIICNLSSDEYSKAVIKHAKSRIITPIFLDNKNNGQIGSVPIYSKMMRGVLANWMIVNQVDDPVGLQAFSAQGYHYDAAHSTANQPAFLRQAPSPIRFHV